MSKLLLSLSLGYYRVHYAGSNWWELIKVLNSTPEVIHKINRAQLIDDVFAMARPLRSYTNYDLAFNLASYLKNEKDLVPWKSALHSFDLLYFSMARTSAFSKFQKFLASIISPQFERLTLEIDDINDSHTTRILRTLLSKWACKLGVQACVDSALEIFSDMSQSDNLPHPDVRAAVMCTGGRYRDFYNNQVFNNYILSIDSYDQSFYINAVACVPDEESLNLRLNYSIGGRNFIREEHLAPLFSALLETNPQWADKILGFVQNNLDVFAEKNLLSNAITSLGAKLWNLDDAIAMYDLNQTIFESDNPAVRMHSSLADKTMEKVNLNNLWLSTKGVEIIKWLNDQEHTDNDDDDGDNDKTTAAPGSSSVLATSCLLMTVTILITTRF